MNEEKKVIIINPNTLVFIIAAVISVSGSYDNIFDYKW